MRTSLHMKLAKLLSLGLLMLLPDIGSSSHAENLSANQPMYLTANIEPQVLELRQGKFEAVKAPTTLPTSDPMLSQAEQLINSGQVKRGKAMALQWVKQNQTSPIRDRGLYLLAQANFRLGDREQAYYEYDELLDLYPESNLFMPALERQYEIADAYMNGYKERLLWMSILPKEDDGVEMLYRIQQRSPGSPLAEKSLLRTGNFFYTSGDFDLAGDVYEVYVKSYPRSPEVPRVKLRQAFANYAQFRGLKFDATPIIDAREQLGAIVSRYPKLAQEENIGPVIERIDEAFARKLFHTGEFYIRTNEAKAAVYTWRYLIKTYPKSADATRAKNKLAGMSAKELSDPEPPAGNGYAPSTTNLR